MINLLGRIGNLGYRGVLGTQDQPEYNQSAPVLELRLRLKDGGTREYRISKVKDGQDYVLKAADRPWYFKLSEFDLEGLLDVNRAKLLGLEPEPTPPAAATDGQEPGDAVPEETSAGAGAEPPPQPAPAQ